METAGRLRLLRLIALSFVLAPTLASAFPFTPEMKGRNSYVTLTFGADGRVSSTAITPADGSWTAPTYPSTYLCRTPDDATDRADCRSYAIYIPKNYDGTRPLPLHLSLHGNGGFSEQQIGDVPKNDGTATTAGDNSGLEGRYNQLADEHGFIVAYPNGIPNGGSTVNGRMFNDCRISEPAGSEVSDDIRYIGALLDDAMGSLNIDRNRVYANGYSNGAIMTLRLYQELGERFTAFAVAEGAQPKQAESECKPITAKKPIFFVFGDLDVVVPYTGVGVRSSMLSADDTIAYWTQYLGTQDQPTLEDTLLWTQTWTPVPNVSSTDGAPDSRGYTKVFGGGVEGSEGVGPTQVLVKKIEGGGHSLSGLSAYTSPTLYALLGPKNLDIALADELVAFFEQFAMNSATSAAAAPLQQAPAAPATASGSGQFLLGALGLPLLATLALAPLVRRRMLSPTR